MTTRDGLNLYLTVMDSLKRENVDYAVLHKLYGSTDAEHRYSPAKCIGVEGRPAMGNPDPEKILASYVERQNHTMRMGMRRFTRFSNGFSNEIENLTHAVSLHYMHYIRKTPPVTRTANPAMAAGIESHPWTVWDIASLIE